MPNYGELLPIHCVAPPVTFPSGWLRLCSSGKVMWGAQEVGICRHGSSINVCGFLELGFSVPKPLSIAPSPCPGRDWGRLHDRRRRRLRFWHVCLEPGAQLRHVRRVSRWHGKSG
jgi:hypothetical protein